jgi:hypothetical protein
MPAFSIRLPESLHRAAREVAAEDGVSLNQLIASALGEKIAALKTVEFLRERGQCADAADLAAVLALVPDAEPEEQDRFPSS